jgi:hypothetical protein
LLLCVFEQNKWFKIFFLINKSIIKLCTYPHDLDLFRDVVVRPEEKAQAFRGFGDLVLWQKFESPVGMVLWYRPRLRKYGSWDRIPPGNKVVVQNANIKWSLENGSYLVQRICFSIIQFVILVVYSWLHGYII